MSDNNEEKDLDSSMERLYKAFSDVSSEGELPCAAAFEVAAANDWTPERVGAVADRLGFHLVKCQLGLFGYPPRKKIVTPLETVDDDLSAAIRSAVNLSTSNREGTENNRLSCRRAWQIADQFNVGRMVVSAACETLEIKIKPCQLGAF